ncbi:hypothetical protein PACTADRAFT_47708 [Pachysolen tannophilus NRRL Y-2460]|uniref:UBZ4-type domain-containing protein n=1 Tax=Pachysolen tannophilus NRRL Y-2460 TaxID=669874 RepID=A0A1E4U1I1_PACTA|nr:hypothetical protein PACTADRAFT_47708 [Pachysolen tannophilus NRRL Y-2460]
MVSCPVCAKEIEIGLINRHLDTCTSSCSRVESNVSTKSNLTNILNGNRSKSRSSLKKERNYTPSLKRARNEVVTIDDDETSSVSEQNTSNISLFVPDSPPPSTIDQHQDVDDEAIPPSKKLKKDSSPPPPPYTLTPQYHLEEELKLLKSQAKLPLAEKLRPKNLDQYIGQQHLVGPNGILRGFIERDRIPSMILWGPPGVGKTSLCRIISHETHSRFVELSATSSGISECRKVFEEAKNEYRLTKRQTVLFCDEIHRFNKAQQDIFLPYVEKGDIILIGATTENPSFQLNSALLSRCRVFVLNKLEVSDLNKVLCKAILIVNKTRKLLYNQPILKFNKQSVDYLSDLSDGDSRGALNLLEIADSHFLKSPSNNNNNNNNDISNENANFIDITPELLKHIFKRTHLIYDRVGDAHYDTISAFHKSVRGSDANAALYYLGKMIKGGENPLYIARRMIRIASEDIGVLDNTCLPLAIAAYQAVQFVGLPEADLALVQCAYKLCQAPKSVLIYRAWNKICSYIDKDPGFASAPIPLHLRNAPTKLMKDLDYSKGYKYNPDYLNGEVVQEYLPEKIKGTNFLDGKHLGDIADPDLQK